MTAVYLTADVSIKSSPVVSDFGILLDAELTTKQHVNNVARSCFFQLRRIRRLRRCVDDNTLYVYNRIDLITSCSCSSFFSVLTPVYPVNRS